MMTAKSLHRIGQPETYSHVYNEGVEKRVIFNDGEDYGVFLGYLRDYLSSPLDPESLKKTFTVNGKAFRGTPHQPKNYLGKVELIAYRLTPTHFHLILYQKAHGALQSFIRSLCTRYSIYYNKKYHRTGSLFDGPYKSLHIKDFAQLLHFTRYLHRSPDNGEEVDEIASSFPVYTGKNESPWVNTKVILSAMDAKKYKDFVAEYKLDKKERDLLEGAPLDSKPQHLERSVLESQPQDTLKTGTDSYLKPFSRVPELLGISAVFLLLLGMGIRNISLASSKNVATSPSNETPVLSESTEATTPPQPKDVVMVKISDGAASINIRQSPTTQSKKIGEAKDGDTFEFLALESGWYQVRLPDGTTGWISSMYAFSLEPNSP